VQRHGFFERDKNSEIAGHLTEEARLEEAEFSRRFIEEQISLVPVGERDKVDFLFLASDTSYANKGKRSMETADIALDQAKSILNKLGLSESQILNFSERIKGEAGSRPMSDLRAPMIFDDSPDFVQYLSELYPTDGGGKGKAFWDAYYQDRERIKREEVGAEGPDDLADRLNNALQVVKRFSHAYHLNNPERRLIVWMGTHYDTIMPFVRRDLYGLDNEKVLAVDYGAGITIKVDQQGNMDTDIAGKRYNINQT
jgi:hypothetical protein